MQLSDQKILENNLLIQNYLGYYELDINKEYHNSYSLLMEVFNKINNRDLMSIHKNSCRIISANTCLISQENVFREFDPIIIENKNKPVIYCIYFAVIKYLKWLKNNHPEEFV